MNPKPSNQEKQPGSTITGEGMREILIEIKNVKKSHFQLSLILSVSILFVSLLGVVMLAFGINYLFKFKVDKVDALVSAGIEKLDMENRLVLPNRARLQLISNPNSYPIYWDKDSEIWMVKSPNGSLPFNHFRILPVKEWENLQRMGFSFENGIWISPPDLNSPPLSQPLNSSRPKNPSANERRR